MPPVAPVPGQMPPVAPYPYPSHSRDSSDEYIHRGSWELGFNGFVAIPHTSPGDTYGFGSGRVGYYFAHNSLVGTDFSVLASNGAQVYFPSCFYRYVQHTGNAQFFPFFGVAAGGLIGHSGGTESYFTARGEAGIKYFVASNVSFDAAYNLLYARVEGADFKESTLSMITLGFSLTSKPERSHPQQCEAAPVIKWSGEPRCASD